MDYKLGFSYAEALDLNGDNYNDIRISCISGSGGNTENTVFYLIVKPICSNTIAVTIYRMLVMINKIILLNLRGIRELYIVRTK